MKLLLRARTRLRRLFSAAEAHSSVLVPLVALVLILVPYLWRLWYLEFRYFDQDEFEHLHVAWSVSRGLLPYTDFFEVHMPWLYFMLSPFFGAFRVDTNVEEAVRFLIFARQLSWAGAGGILLGTFALGCVWRNVTTGCVAALLLTNAELFLATTTEVRPDVFSTLCWMFSLAALLYGLRAASASPTAKWYFGISGFLFGAALMFTQKLLFALPGLGLALTWYVFEHPVKETVYRRLKHVAYIVVGTSVPVVATVGFLAWRHAAGAFLHYTLFFAATFQDDTSPWRYLAPVLYNSPYLAVLASLACLQLAGRLAQALPRCHSIADATLLFTVGSLFVGLILIPVPFSQYFLTFLPIAAVLSAGFLLESFARLAKMRAAVSPLTWGSVAVAILLVLLILFAPAYPHVIAAYWLSATFVALLLVSWRTPTLGVIAFLLLMSVAPMYRLHSWFDARWSNAQQLAEVRYLMNHTQPSDTVLDGFTGIGIFRPHAYFYYMLHRGISLSLGDEPRRRLLQGLQAGRIAPKFIVFDSSLRAFSPEVTTFLEEHYQSVGLGDLWRRREGTAPDHVQIKLSPTNSAPLP